MLIQSEFDIQFDLPQNVPMIAMLRVHPSVEPQLVTADTFKVECLNSGGADGGNQEIKVDDYLDSFGNRCSRFSGPAGPIRLSGSKIVNASDTPDPQGFGIGATLVEQLPADTLQFLLASRYCQVDQFGGISQDMFGGYAPGWETAAAIRDWVHNKVAFNYKAARSTKTAMDVFTERWEFVAIISTLLSP